MWKVYVTKNKIVLFLYYRCHGMNFYSCEKQINKSFIRQSTASNNDSRPIFPYHVKKQADFENPFIKGKGFIYLGISKMSLTF